MEENLRFLEVNHIEETSIKELSALSLAFIGDAVYELLVRTYILKGNKTVNGLHREAIGYVKAKAQADSIRAVLGELTKEELSVYRRGRNTNPHTVPKNAKLSDYREATGLEALFGYLYLKDRGKRIIEIFNMMEDEKDES
ncbi:Mini-ribonuclease 3 [Peptoniphilus catoniae]|uniref:Mini-ribonuclease 3 n=1 Tax=Peptoniphilus catoniae TaxID=1660341 RepID=UPI0010FD08D0|nr:ribonuclease III domain-containing protein [Peptoniphilus catoniae]